MSWIKLKVLYKLKEDSAITANKHIIIRLKLIPAACRLRRILQQLDYWDRGFESC